MASRPDVLITSGQIRAARMLLGWTQQELAEKSSVSLNACAKLEQEKGDARMSTVMRIKRALEEGGVFFIDATDSHGVGVVLKKP
jgi:predicted transcriptional regulator